MLQPRKSKYRKQFKPRRLPGNATKGNLVSFGDFGLRAEESGHISSRQIESARRAIVHFIKRGGRVWIRIFPDKPMTNHGTASVMGGGKGAVDHFVAVVKKGRILFEMDGVTHTQAKEAMRLASHKLPVKTKFLSKEQTI